MRTMIEIFGLELTVRTIDGIKFELHQREDLIWEKMYSLGRSKK